MLNLIHLAAIILGILSYSFSDVNSSSGFYNTFLPFVVLLSFIYGVIVTISLLFRSRVKSNSKNKSADLLLASLKQQGLLDKGSTVNAALNLDVPTVAPSLKKLQPKPAVKRQGKIKAAKMPSSFESADDSTVDIDSINQQEWASPENWNGTSMFAVYFSHRDSRTWVPSRSWLIWRTLNLAKSLSLVWLALFWFGLLVLSLISLG